MAVGARTKRRGDAGSVSTPAWRLGLTDRFVLIFSPFYRWARPTQTYVSPGRGGRTLAPNGRRFARLCRPYRDSMAFSRSSPAIESLGYYLSPLPGLGDRRLAAQFLHILPKFPPLPAFGFGELGQGR